MKAKVKMNQTICKTHASLALGAAIALSISLCFTTVARAQSVATLTSSNLFEPNSITTDPNLNGYVTDGANNRVVKYDPNTAGITVLAGSAGVTGHADGYGPAASFSQPAGIVYARGGLVVADSGNHLLRFVTLDGTVSTFAGVPDGVPGLVNTNRLNAKFSYPQGLAVDANGNIFVADMGNNAIRMIDTNDNVTTYQTGFYQPNGVAVGTNGEVWVADTRHDVISRIGTNHVTTIIAGALNAIGTNDATPAINGRLNRPAGLTWLPDNSGLLIADTGNNTIRHLYYNVTAGAWTMETSAGLPGAAGYTDGAPATSKFNAPIGIAADIYDTGFYIVDSANNALRRLQTTAPLPPVPPPTIGYVIFVFNSERGRYESFFNETHGGIFNNPTIIAVKTDVGTASYMTYGPTPTSFTDTIPTPNPQTATSPIIYKGDGVPVSDTAPSVIPIMPDITMKTISTAPGRRPSSVITNRFQYKVANPSVSGDNAASFSFSCQTTNATLWYTIDGSDPTNSPPSIGPVVGNQQLTILLTNDIVLKVRGFYPNFAPSEIVSKSLTVSNFNANKMTFGFENGEASSDFVAAAGQRFFAPVTLSLLDGQSCYSMQFNATVTNLGPSPAITPNAYGFQSMLMFRDTGSNGIFYTVIRPAIFTGTYATNGDPIIQDGIFTNSSENLLGIGWFERLGRTNDFNTRLQDLISFSMAHDTVFTSVSKKVLVGGYYFSVPLAATNGQQYQIQLNRASATADGIAAPMYIQTPTNGSYGQGPINSIKNVTVGSRQYLVGDCVPFRWFNAGDFGDTNLLNDDISDLFQSVAYDLNRPPEGSDFFDCMDSSDDRGTLDGNDTQINNIQFGDGQLNVNDVYVTFRRSLDPSLTWYARYWSNGVRQAVAIPNVVTGSSSPQTLAVKTPASPSIPTTPRFVNVAPDDVQGYANGNVYIPIRASISGNLPIRVMAMNIDVISLDGAPPISYQVGFSPAGGLGQPMMSMSQTASNYAAIWLDSTVAGVSGTNLIGTLQVSIPSNATPSSAWLVHFTHLSVSPNGVGLFPLSKQDALITCSDRSSSSWGDGIPDSWRLRWFGSVSNLLSGANLDPDGDGVTNLGEYQAGTNPLDGISRLNLQCQGGAPRNGLSWPSVFGKNYSVECSSTLFGGSWSVIGTVPGTGQTIQFADPNPDPSMRFYRVRTQ